jgi:hypothetical protein
MRYPLLCRGDGVLHTGLTPYFPLTFTLSGTPVTDLEALQQMDLPDHETAIEVPIGKEIRPV